MSFSEPKPEAILLGNPIIDFRVRDLHDSTFVDTLRACLEEWVSMDAENIVRRRVGLAIAYGYTQWETNRPPL